MRPLQFASIGNKKDHRDVVRRGQGLWSPIPEGQSAIASPRRIPSLHFDTRATALETWPLPAILCTHAPATSTNFPATGAGGDSRPTVRRPICHCACPVALPCSPPTGRFTTFRARHCLLCRSVNGVPASAGNSIGDRPVIAPLRELRLSARECDFPGINIRSCQCEQLRVLKCNSIY